MIEIAALSAEGNKSRDDLQSLQPDPAPGYLCGRLPVPDSQQGESLEVPLLQPGAARYSRNLSQGLKASWSQTLSLLKMMLNHVEGV